MASRLELHDVLEGILGTDNVYFQPPSSFQMKYPCIVYERSNEFYRFADNMKYVDRDTYDITVIDRDPDSEIPDRVSALPYSSFNRFFISDNLNHTVYQLIY